MGEESRRGPEAEPPAGSPAAEVYLLFLVCFFFLKHSKPVSPSLNRPFPILTYLLPHRRVPFPRGTEDSQVIPAWALEPTEGGSYFMPGIWQQ